MYAIIIAFIVLANGARGEGVIDERFDTIMDCEQVRIERVDGFKLTMDQMHHGIVISSSYCGLPTSIGSEPA